MAGQTCSLDRFTRHVRYIIISIFTMRYSKTAASLALCLLGTAFSASAATPAATAAPARPETPQHHFLPGGTTWLAGYLPALLEGSRRHAQTHLPEQTLPHAEHGGPGQTGHGLYGRLCPAHLLPHPVQPHVRDELRPAPRDELDASAGQNHGCGPQGAPSPSGLERQRHSAGRHQIFLEPLICR